jgi:hypothetical protein
VNAFKAEQVFRTDAAGIAIVETLAPGSAPPGVLSMPVFPESAPRRLSGLLAQPPGFVSGSSGLFARPLRVLTRTFGLIEGSLDVVW